MKLPRRVWLCALLSASAHAQVPTLPPGPVSPPAQPLPVPTQTPTFPPPPAPAFVAGAANEVTVHADDLGHYDDVTHIWTGQGHVTIRYRDDLITADSGEYDEETEIATLRGHVVLDNGRDVVTGTATAVLTFNTAKRTWTFSEATTDIQPAGALAPVHISAKNLSGTGHLLTLHNVHVTTCDVTKPAYELVARDMTIIPNDRIIAKHATTYFYGHAIITLPAVVLPIRRGAAGRPPVVPVFGQSTDEGFFVKTSLNYAGGHGQSGAFHVDLLQKQGLGLGVTHDYNSGGTHGEAALYTIIGSPDGQNLTANIRHHQKLFGFDTDFTGDLRQNSYLYLPGTTSRNAALNMTRTQLGSATTIALRYDGSSGSAYDYTNFSSSLAEGYKYSAKGTVRFGLDYTTQSGSAATTQQLASHVDVTQGLRAVDVEIAANKQDTFGTETGFFQPVQRLPELTVRTDAYRLGLTEAKTAPVAFQFATGSFNENNVKADRQLLVATMPVHKWSLGSTKLDLGGAFTQAVYSDDAAEYTLTGNVKLDQPIGARNDLALAYNVQRPRGYTPFRFDQPFAYNSLTGSLKVAALRHLEIRAGTGYDFQNHVTPWHDVLAFIQYQPSDGIRFTTNIDISANGADPGQPTPIRYLNNGIRLRLGKFHFDGESRYLPGTHTFGRLLGNLDTPIGRHWSVRALAGVDNGQRYRHLLAVRDLGCMEASVAIVNDHGWRNETGIRVMLRIKAFPVAEPFGTGMFGENLDIGDPGVAFGGVASGPLGVPSGDPYM